MQKSHMIFSLRNTFIAVLLFFALLGTIFTLISAQVSYQNLENNAKTEKGATIELIGSIIFDESRTDGFNVDNINTLLSIPAKERGVIFFRLVGLNSQTILASSNQAEVGKYLDQLPRAENSHVVNAPSAITPQTLDITYKKGEEMLWMSIENVFFTGPTLIVVVQQVFFILTMLVLLGFVLYVVGTNFITKPIRTLSESIDRFGKGDLELRVGEGPPNEVGTLYQAFNQMSSRIEGARERERDASETKSRFFTVASHKLKTPLTGIKWDLNALSAGEMGALSDVQKKMVDHALEKAQNLISMLQSMLEIADADEVKKAYTIEKLSLPDEIALVMNEFAEKAKEHHVLLRSELSDDVAEASVFGDKAEIHRVFESIVENAIIYMNGEGTVTIRARRDSANPHFIECLVEDTGMGIPQDELAHIFDRFYRGREAMLKDTEGSGLKLFMVRKIIEEHGGHVRVSSEVGKGSTFSFTLPTQEDLIPKEFRAQHGVD